MFVIGNLLDTLAELTSKFQASLNPQKSPEIHRANPEGRLQIKAYLHISSKLMIYKTGYCLWMSSNGISAVFSWF